MGIGKSAKYSTGKVLLFLFLVLLGLFCAVTYFSYHTNKQESTDNPNLTEPTNAEIGIYDDTESAYVDGDDTIQTDATAMPTEVAPTEALTQHPESDQTESQETLPPVVIPQKENAEYEKWLAATVVVGVSLEYPDFIPEGIYSTSATSLEEKFSSDGVYIIFASNGVTMAIHSKPVAAERSEPGTKDISSENVGFATFDLVDPAGINVDSMERIAFEELSELIAQSMLISIYSR